MKMRIYTLKTRSGLHCGIGQGLSDIDLPTARESVSGYPIVPGSSLKGVLRDHFKPVDSGQSEESEKFFAAFGPDTDSSGEIDYASALSFTDSRLICLPVRSYFGTFAYMASPYSLNILKVLLKQAEWENLPPIPSYPSPKKTDSYRASVTKDSKLISFGRLENSILLEDLDLLVDANSSSLADAWADVISRMLYPGDAEEAQLFKDRFVIADDNVMAFFCESALPVAAHTKIGENGVVQERAFWYEEFVPPEAIFVGAVFGEAGKGDKYKKFSAGDLIDFVCSSSIDCQVGGNATTGRGLVSITFPVKGGGNDKE